jgi:isochorismate hydrolase
VGGVIVLQIEHIDLEFNIKVHPFPPSLWRSCVARSDGRRSRGVKGKGRLIVIIRGEPEMNALSRIQREEAVLVVVDVQDALMKKMNPGVGEKVIRNIRTLLAFAQRLAIPVLITEQYPKGLGPTVSEIKMELGSILPVEKVSFSCCGVETFNAKLNQTGRKQVILVGIETHVCILQTADDLLQAGHEVHAVADAICSQRKLDWEVGLRWMEKRGAMISTTEIIAFQLLKEAGTEEFRGLSKLLK